MGGQSSVLLACAVVGLLWATVGLVLLVTRLLRSRAARTDLEVTAVRDGWDDWPQETAAPPAGLESDSIELLRQGLWSGELEVRRAAVSALGELAARSDLAIDGLIEALAERRDAPARIAMQLDRVAPRADARLVPLLGHPESVVRCYAARLLSRSDSAQLRHVLELSDDPSPRVRVAALRALESTSAISALKTSLRRLDDPHPRVRAQACRTASAISPTSAAGFVAPALRDESWEVRQAAQTALVRAGSRAVVDAVVPLLDDDDPETRSLAETILQEIGETPERSTHRSIAFETRP